VPDEHEMLQAADGTAAMATPVSDMRPVILAIAASGVRATGRTSNKGRSA
jgi:hypothetical protein